jgi:hypothetical protein
MRDLDKVFWNIFFIVLLHEGVSGRKTITEALPGMMDCNEKWFYRDFSHFYPVFINFTVIIFIFVM